MRAIRAAFVAALLISVAGCGAGYVGAGYGYGYGYDSYPGYYYSQPGYGNYGTYPYRYYGYYGPYRGNYETYTVRPNRYGGYEGRPTYRGTTVRPYYGAPSTPYRGGRHYRR